MQEIINRAKELLADGTVTGTPEQSLADVLLQWRQWSYYKLKYQEFK